MCEQQILTFLYVIVLLWLVIMEHFAECYFLRLIHIAECKMSLFILTTYAGIKWTYLIYYLPTHIYSKKSCIVDIFNHDFLSTIEIDGL